MSIYGFQLSSTEFATDSCGSPRLSCVDSDRAMKVEVAFIFMAVDVRHTGTMEIGRLLVQIRILEVLTIS